MAVGEVGDFQKIGSNVMSVQEVGLALCYEEELRIERDNVSSWT